MLLVENRELLRRFRRGDQSALKAVYVHYSSGVAGFLRTGFTFNSGGRSCRFYGTRAQSDLEDRLHDVFARAFSVSARLSYDGLSPYKAYLNAIARNLIIDEYRSKARALAEFQVENGDSIVHEPAELADPIRGIVEAGGDPESDTASAELVALVEQFRESLGPRERQVYQLRLVDELPHTEVQDRSGLTPSQIKTSEQRIRERFFSFMQSHGYFSCYALKSRGWIGLFRRLKDR